MVQNCDVGGGGVGGWEIQTEILIRGPRGRNITEGG